MKEKIPEWTRRRFLSDRAGNPLALPPPLAACGLGFFSNRSICFCLRQICLCRWWLGMAAAVPQGSGTLLPGGRKGWPECPLSCGVSYAWQNKLPLIACPYGRSWGRISHPLEGAAGFKRFSVICLLKKYAVEARKNLLWRCLLPLPPLSNSIRAWKWCPDFPNGRAGHRWGSRGMTRGTRMVGAEVPGLESKARRTWSCRRSRFPGAPGTDRVMQRHATGASLCPRTAVCVSSSMISARREHLLWRVVWSNQVKH